MPTLAVSQEVFQTCLPMITSERLTTFKLNIIKMAPKSRRYSNQQNLMSCTFFGTKMLVAHLTSKLQLHILSSEVCFKRSIKAPSARYSKFTVLKPQPMVHFVM